MIIRIVVKKEQKKTKNKRKYSGVALTPRVEITPGRAFVSTVLGDDKLNYSGWNVSSQKNQLYAAREAEIGARRASLEDDGRQGDARRSSWRKDGGRLPLPVFLRKKVTARAARV